jgi:hypothetical protein
MTDSPTERRQPSTDSNPGRMSDPAATITQAYVYKAPPKRDEDHYVGRVGLEPTTGGL